MLLDYTQTPTDLEKTRIENEWPLKGPDWHRRFVGARNAQLWDSMGRAQLDFLIQHGMTRSSILLDVGCGSLKLGVLAIPYLIPYHYIGLDISERLVRAGIEQELSQIPAWKFRLPRFIITDDFALDDLWPKSQVDYAIAQSVFTHLSPTAIRQCLKSIVPHVRVAFFASFNRGKITNIKKDPVYPNMARYPVDFFKAMAKDLDISCTFIGAWGIPQNKRKEQLMLRFERTRRL